MASRFFTDGDDGKPEPDLQPPQSATIQPLEGIRKASGPRIALLIGNSAYPAGALQNPTNDVDLLAGVLRKLSFDVLVLKDAGKSEMEHAIVDFGGRLAGVDGEAIALFYFAGHGVQAQGQNYLIPVDARIPEARYLRSGAIKVDFLLDELAQMRPHASLVVLDACRNNPIPITFQGPEALRGLAAIENVPDATAIVFSTAAGAVASDGDESNSPYATALARALDRRGRTLQEVIFDAARAVGAATQGAQRPALFVQGALPEVRLSETSERTTSQRNAGPWGRLEEDREPTNAGRETALPDPGTTFEQAQLVSQHGYGLSAEEWQQGFPFDIVDKVIALGRWAEVETAFQRNEPRAAALVAIRAYAIDRPAWGAPDVARAARAARIAAAAGLRHGFVVLAWLHESGAGGLPRDASTARSIMASLAERGYVYAEQAMGIYVARGFGGQASAVQAMRWLERAASKGAMNAYYEIGLLYTEFASMPYEVNYLKAEEWLRKAVDRGHVRAASLLADIYCDGRLPAPSHEIDRLLDLAAAKGDAQALARRAFRAEHGDGRSKDLASALRDYEAAAELGHADSMLALSYFYTYGTAANAPDPTSAVRWSEGAARFGRHEAMFNLGLFAETGYGIETSSTRAAEQYRAALALGNANAGVALARLILRHGLGTPDLPRARSLAEAAARQRDMSVRHGAAVILSQLEMQDRLGVARSPFPDLAVGAKGAPVTASIFYALDSADCAAFHEQVVARLRNELAPRGHIRLVFREGPGGTDASAAMLVRSLEGDQQLAVFERLLETQSRWRGKPGASDILAELVADLGIARSHVAQTLARAPLLDAVTFLANKAAPDLGVSEVPTVFINGRMLVRPELRAMRTAVLEALPPEVAFELNGGPMLRSNSS